MLLLQAVVKLWFHSNRAWVGVHSTLKGSKDAFPSTTTILWLDLKSLFLYQLCSLLNEIFLTLELGTKPQMSWEFSDCHILKPSYISAPTHSGTAYCSLKIVHFLIKA